MEESSNINMHKRNIIFSNENVNLLKKDESHKLGLRKKFIDSYLFEIRKKEMLKNKINFEIDVQKLKIADEYKNFIITDTNDDNQFQTLIFMLSSKNMPYIKFGVYLLRKYICNSDSVNPLIMKRKQIYDEIINLYLDSKKLDYELKYEIYWILINSTENNQHLMQLFECKEKFFIEMEKDFNLNNDHLNELIIWLCCNITFDSDRFASNLPKMDIFHKILNNLTKKIQKINSVSPTTIQSLKLIHILIAKKRKSIEQIPIDIIKDILLALLNYSDELNDEELRTHFLFSLYFLLDNNDQKIKVFVLENKQLIFNIMKLDLNLEVKDCQLILRIIGNLLRGSNEIVDVIKCKK